MTVKLVSDAFARPLSLLTTKPWCSPKCLALISIARLVVGSVLFFLYTFTEVMHLFFANAVLAKHDVDDIQEQHSSIRICRSVLCNEWADNHSRLPAWEAAR